MSFRLRIIIGLLPFLLVAAEPAPLHWSVRMADAQIARDGDRRAWTPEGGARWDYAAGLFTWSLLQLAERVPERRHVAHAERVIGSFITADGGIRGYRVEDANLDNLNPGRTLLALHQLTGEARYRRAADLLRRQLDVQPRTADGGFWHKRRYPHQMWLDGLYMAGPFYTRHTQITHGPSTAYDDIARQFRLVGAHTWDERSGLFRHGWDESREQTWADRTTGCSPHAWARAIGWYAMAVVDVLECFPADHPARPELVTLLSRIAAGVVRWQDAASGLWWQVMDQGDRPGNYLESTASAMFVYALAKGVDSAWLPETCRPALLAGWQGLTGRLVTTAADGTISLTRCCQVAGLGYGRDGSFDYYVHEPIVDNDLKGVGPFILAGLALQRLQDRPGPAAKP